MVAGTSDVGVTVTAGAVVGGTAVTTGAVVLVTVGAVVAGTVAAGPKASTHSPLNGGCRPAHVSP